MIIYLTSTVKIIACITNKVCVSAYLCKKTIIISCNENVDAAFESTCKNLLNLLTSNDEITKSKFHELYLTYLLKYPNRNKNSYYSNNIDIVKLISFINVVNTSNGFCDSNIIKLNNHLQTVFKNLISNFTKINTYLGQGNLMKDELYPVFKNCIMYATTFIQAIENADSLNYSSLLRTEKEWLNNVLIIKKKLTKFLKFLEDFELANQIFRATK